MDALASIRPVATSWLLRSNIAELVQPFRERLVERRYASKVVRSYVYCLAHFAHWAQRRPGGAIASVEHSELFLDPRRSVKFLRVWSLQIPPSDDRRLSH